MTDRRLTWTPDDHTIRILAAYRARREDWQAVLRRAVKLLAQADGVIDGRGRIINERQQTRERRGQA